MITCFRHITDDVYVHDDDDDEDEDEEEEAGPSATGIVCFLLRVFIDV